MKKLLTILTLSTILSCSKQQEQPITTNTPNYQIRLQVIEINGDTTYSLIKNIR